MVGREKNEMNLGAFPKRLKIPKILQKYIQFRFSYHRITTEIVIGCTKDDKSASKVKYSRRNFIINRSDMCICHAFEHVKTFQYFFRYLNSYFIGTFINIILLTILLIFWHRFHMVSALIQPRLQDFRHHGQFYSCW